MYTNIQRYQQFSWASLSRTWWNRCECSTMSSLFLCDALEIKIWLSHCRWKTLERIDAHDRSFRNVIWIIEWFDVRNATIQRSISGWWSVSIDLDSDHERGLRDGSFIHFRHMSKHERQHNLSNMTTNHLTEENASREAKRARLEQDSPGSSASWSTLYVNTQMKDETNKSSDEPQTLPPSVTQSNTFSSCFSTDKLLMPDQKKSPSYATDKMK